MHRIGIWQIADKHSMTRFMISGEKLGFFGILVGTLFRAQYNLCYGVFYVLIAYLLFMSDRPSLSSPPLPALPS